MLSLPDFKEKKILLINPHETEINSLKIKNWNICLYKDDKIAKKISIHIVFIIFVIGEFTFSSQLIKELQEFGISIFFLNKSFKLYGEVNSQTNGNYLLRERQYTAESEFQLDTSKYLVANKIKNQNKIYKRVIGQKIDIKPYLSKIGASLNIDSLRGIEGNFSKIYFGDIFKEIGWYRRAPQTKEDIPNFLLDIGYTFMFNYVDSLLNAFGFDTYKGVFHQLFFQRKSLSCDLMEPLRPLIDYQLIKSYNLKQIDEKDFKFINGGFKLKNYKLNSKYSKIWFDMIVKNNVQIYKYVRSYYYYYQMPEKYSFTEFKIK